jgi:pilus assembly protein CpaE
MAKAPEVLIIGQDVQARFEVKKLVRQSQFNISGEAGFGTEAVSLALELEPDLVLCAISEPVARSLQTVDSLLNALPETPVIVYSSSRDIDLARKAMVAGARDFLTMPATPADMTRSILSVLEAEERRRMRATGQTLTWGSEGSVVTVFAAKGGVGKTTIAVNVAVALAQETTQSVVLVDGDSGFGDVASMLDLTPERTLTDLVRDLGKVTRETLPKYLARHSSGLNVLAAPADTLDWRTVDPEEFRRVIELLSKSHDVVVVDTAGLLNEITVAALEKASLILWIVTTEFSSVRDSLRAIEALGVLSLSEERIHLIINDISTIDGVRPHTIEEVLHRKAFSRVPFDKKVRYGSQVGLPAVISDAGSPGARRLVDLARTVAGIGPRRGGFLARFGRTPGNNDRKETEVETAAEESKAP